MERHTTSESSSESSVEGDNRLYSIQAIPGKGRGIVARSRILKGTRIMSESPLFKFPAIAACDPSMDDVLADEVRGLSDDEQLKFFSLHNADMARLGSLCGIAHTNAFVICSKGLEAGIFLEASLLNHACNPNASNAWNPDSGQMTVHVVRTVEAGEEITITYTDRTATYADRQEALSSSFGFDCSCELCSLPEAQRQERDQKMKEIARLQDIVDDETRMISSPLECLHAARSMLRLLEEEDVGLTRVASLYWDASQIAITNGDEARTKVFLQRSYKARIECEGNDGPEMEKMRQYIRTPSTHPRYGVSMRWVRAPVDIPDELDKPEFDDWLWRSTEGDNDGTGEDTAS